MYPRPHALLIVPLIGIGVNNYVYGESNLYLKIQNHTFVFCLCCVEIKKGKSKIYVYFLEMNIQLYRHACYFYVKRKPPVLRRITSTKKEQVFKRSRLFCLGQLCIFFL